MLELILSIWISLLVVEWVYWLVVTAVLIELLVRVIVLGSGVWGRLDPALKTGMILWRALVDILSQLSIAGYKCVLAAWYPL